MKTAISRYLMPGIITLLSATVIGSVNFAVRASNETIKAETEITELKTQRQEDKNFVVDELAKMDHRFDKIDTKMDLILSKLK